MFTKKLKTEANIFIQFSYVLIVFVLRSQCREYGMVCGTHLRLLAPWATRLLSQRMVHWWRVNDSTAR